MARVAPASGFDALASSYRWLETLAFGGALMRARIAHFSHLATCQKILVVGDGDGRALIELLQQAPAAHIDSIDISPRMIAQAKARLPQADLARVTFTVADARTVPLNGPYDGVVTAFVLDCFTPEDTAALIRRVAARLTPDARWIYTDFAVPASGLTRLHARVVVGGLYAFFRWRTGIEARELPPVEAELAAVGLRVVATRTWRAGLVRSALFQP